MRSLGFTLFLSTTVHAVAAVALLVGFSSTGSPDHPNIIVTDLIFEVEAASTEPAPGTEIAAAAYAATALPELEHPEEVSGSAPTDQANESTDPTTPSPASGIATKGESAPPIREESDGVSVGSEQDHMPSDFRTAEQHPVEKAAVATPISAADRKPSWTGHAPRNKPMPPPSQATSVATPPVGDPPVTAAQAQSGPATEGNTPSVTRGGPTAMPTAIQHALSLAALPPSRASGVAPTDEVGREPARYAGTALGNRPPKYPYAARRTGAEGRVVIEVSVGRNGGVLNASVAESSGHRLLDRSALEAVRNWTFIPARRSGHPVASTIAVPVVFLLASETTSARE